ncbi:MAG: hypothetical protein ACE1Y9_03010, partial [Acidimicrobiia bacterium]
MQPDKLVEAISNEIRQGTWRVETVSRHMASTSGRRVGKQGGSSRLTAMETSSKGLIRIPLRIAGIIGLTSAVIYIGVALGQEDTSLLPQAFFWFGVMLDRKS